MKRRSGSRGRPASGRQPGSEGRLDVKNAARMTLDFQHFTIPLTGPLRSRSEVTIINATTRHGLPPIREGEG